MSVLFRIGCRCFGIYAAVGFHRISRADDAPASKDSKTPDLAKDTADAAASRTIRLPTTRKRTPAPTAKPKLKKLKQLTPEMTERRDRVRRLLTALRQQPFNTQQNDCSDVLEFCRGFGCNTELAGNAGSGQKVNGITCLCWNMPCAATR